MPIKIKTPLMNKTFNDITVSDGIKLYFIAGATVFAGNVLIKVVKNLAGDYKTFTSRYCE
jgi:hypothetical protein